MTVRLGILVGLECDGTRFPLGSGVLGSEPLREMFGRYDTVGWSRDLWGRLLRDWSVAQWIANRVGDLV